MQCLISQSRSLRERRLTNRVGFDCPLRWSDGGADRAGRTYDMSETGIGFVTRTLSAPTRGQRIQVALELDDQNEWLVDTAATVVRADPQDNGLCTVGLHLSQLFTDSVDI